jgi:hypothetical protein
VSFNVLALITSPAGTRPGPGAGVLLVDSLRTFPDPDFGNKKPNNVFFVPDVSGLRVWMRLLTPMKFVCANGKSSNVV